MFPRTEIVRIIMLSNTKPSISGSSLSSSCSSEDGGAYKDVRIAVVGQGGVGKSGKHFFIILLLCLRL